ncbi:MAG: Mur ligase family protein [Acidobacteriaceae bacterium]
MHQLKRIIRKAVPQSLISGYHYFLAQLADMYYRHPTGKMTIIGITGTKGKTSAANYVWSVLTACGYKTGLIGTANIRFGQKEIMNNFHMTMPGPLHLQKLFREMLDQGCTHVVMEATSEGMKLFRHIGIEFDAAIFTNLTPEHLPSHGGSFERYKNEKTKLFKALQSPEKTINGKRVRKTSIINADSDHANLFLSFPSSNKLTFSIREPSDFQATSLNETVTGVDFNVNSVPFHLSLLGGFNVYNALPAIALGSAFGLDQGHIQQGIADLKTIPGRMELIEAGQNFTVIVDYAHEKISMNAVLDTAKKMAKEHKVIVLLGAEGGGRDKAKRPAMGEAAGRKADYVICSNVDPYEDDPFPIANDIAVAAESEGKVRNQNLFVILDRREGIKKALDLAQKGDIVLITGKGAEQSIVIGGKSYPWDDRDVVSEELSKVKNKQQTTGG